MSDIRDPAALIRHAVQVGDWQLLDRVLVGDLMGQAAVAQRAYYTLVVRLGLGDPGNYHRC